MNPLSCALPLSYLLLGALGPQAELQAGLQAKERGDVSAAISSFERAQAQVPGWPLPKLELAELLVREGGYSIRARALLSAAERIDPSNPRLFHLRASVLADDGDLPGAEAAAKRALALRPDYPEAQSELARVVWEEGQRDRALALWQELRASHPENRVVRALLVDRYLDAGRGGDAERELRALLGEDPKNPVWHRRLARLLDSGGRLDDANRERALASRLSGDALPRRKLRRLPESKR